MLRQLFSVKRHRKRSNKSYVLLFLLLILGHPLAMAQGMVRFKADTLSLSRFEFIKERTNNGSDCICSITNTNQANIATVVLTGAPDKNSIVLNDTATFNGIHSLEPGQQLIAVGNFAGRKITVLNLSLMDVVILVMLLCPS